ncbi:MAG: hypothetical protein BTN85_0217 [Candidatus Methanohalarchaeum thermophilum]|uniref:Uncharacterized protein n=1 Tax=Methanohalarchaeum thermophilum TaxID=1903181 RepID=A0A1Q6DTU1_METT1|nr:MAG: hypothetical protein BTN85_0217 [Candidatus Methanohalarchaeum thermophilum]
MSKEKYSFKEMDELMRKIREGKYRDEIQCYRCRRYLDPNDNLLYFICLDERDIKNEEGVIICDRCEEKTDKDKIEFERLI